MEEILPHTAGLRYSGLDWFAFYRRLLRRFVNIYLTRYLFTTTRLPLPCLPTHVRAVWRVWLVRWGIADIAG